MGAGAVSLGLGTVFGLGAKSDADCANEQDSSNVFAVGAQACAESAEEKASKATIFMGVGVALAAGGVGYWLVAGDDGDKVAWQPMIGPESLGLAYTGRF